ncbi:phthiocerol/phthiodiolone dimycocerosyl transferase family protein [Streptomyces ardesiacus]
MPVERRLEPSEAMLMKSPRGIVLQTDIAGPLDTAALERAFVAVLVEDAALRGAITEQADGFVLRADDTPAPDIVRTADRDGFLRAVEAPLHPESALVRLVVGPGGDGADGTETPDASVALLVHHSIADGRAAYTLLHRIWANYTADGSALPPVTGTALRPGAEPLLAGRYPADEVDRAVRAYGGYRDGTPTGPPSNPGGQGRPTLPQDVVVRRLLLDTDATGRLSELARDSGTSVHALLCASLLVADRAALAEETGDGPVRLAGWSVVDLRERVSPAVEALGVTNFTSGVRCGVELTGREDPVEAAREVKRQMDADLAAGIPQRIALRLGEVVGAAFGTDTPPCFLLTNLGRLPELPLPDGTRAIDVRIYIPQPLPVPIYLSYGYGGRLAVELILWRSPEDPDRPRTLLDRLKKVLESAGGDGPTRDGGRLETENHFK